MSEYVNINYDKDIKIKEELHSEISIKSEILSDEDISEPVLLEHIKSEIDEIESEETISLQPTKSDESYHKKLSIFKCDKCDYLTDRKRNSLRHQRSHLRKDFKVLKMYKCNECDYTTKKKWNLTLHQSGHGLPSECDICGNKYKFLSSLNKHKKIHLDNEVIKEENKCKICLKWFPKKSSILLHMHKTHGPIQFHCSECDFVTMKERSFWDHKLKHLDTMFECKECDKQFKWRNSLKKHMEVHQGTTNACTFCGKTYPLRKDLKVHIKRIHTGVMLECTKCDYKIPEAKRMLIHRNNKHKECDVAIDGKYNCRLCSNGFDDLVMLREHMIRHMVWSCDICGFLCGGKFNLGKHMHIHNRNLP